MSYMTISSQENHHFSLCSYFHAHPTTLLLKILGGTNAWAVPHLKFGGTVPPVPLGLRPWFQGYQVSRIKLRLLTQFNRRFPLNLRALLLIVLVSHAF